MSGCGGSIERFTIKGAASTGATSNTRPEPMKNFALIGAAGYIAPRHLRALKDTGNGLLAAVDKADNVGILDSYFPEAAFFTEFEQFERHIDLLRARGTSLDYVSVASPNYLHDSHIRFALRSGADAICEKPVVLQASHAEALMELEAATGRRIFTILQLRLHPALIALRNRLRAEIADRPNERYPVELTYITSRGPWYFASWKGDVAKAGGIASNIGIHFFDMLLWLFGEPQDVDVTLFGPDTASGSMRFANADVKWFLSVNANNLPESAKTAGKRTYRNINIGGEEVEFSDGFTELHTASYEAVLRGEGFGLDAALPSLKLVDRIREADPTLHSLGAHPFAAAILK